MAKKNCTKVGLAEKSKSTAGEKISGRQKQILQTEDTPLKGLLQAADEVAREDSDPEQASLAFICKRLRLNYKKLSEEEKKWLKKISEKSDLLKNPNPQRGKRG